MMLSLNPHTVNFKSKIWRNPSKIIFLENTPFHSFKTFSEWLLLMLLIESNVMPSEHLFDVFIVNFGYNSHHFLIFLLLALKGHMTEAYLEPNQTSMMERFCNYSWRLRAANYFVKKLDLRYLTGLWIYLWFLAISKQQYYVYFNFKNVHESQD